LLYEAVTGGNQFHAPVQARPVPLPAERQSQETASLIYADRQAIAFVKTDDIANIETERHKRRIVSSQRGAIQPDLRAGVHAAEIQPDAHPLPFPEDLELPAVPSRAFVGCPQGPGFCPEVPDDVPVIATEPLPLPTSRNVNSTPERPRILKPPFLQSLVIGVKSEIPLTAQAEPSFPRMSQHRIHPNRRGLSHRH